MKKKPIFPAWYNKFPAWEKTEIESHFEPENNQVNTSFLKQPVPLKKLFFRRSEGEPLEYILGHCHVDQLTLKTDPRALIPRAETETLTRRFADRVPDLPPGPLVDCGTGTGFIAGWLCQSTQRRVLATDAYLPAIKLAAENRELNGWNLKLVGADRLGPLHLKLAGIVANLPYVKSEEKLADSVEKYEPDLAVNLPPSGINFYLTFLRQSHTRLKKGGELWLEGTKQLFDELLEQSTDRLTWKNYTLRKDSFGRCRYLTFTR